MQECNKLAPDPCLQQTTNCSKKQQNSTPYTATLLELISAVATHTQHNWWYTQQLCAILVLFFCKTDTDWTICKSYMDWSICMRFIDCSIRIHKSHRDWWVRTRFTDCPICISFTQGQNENCTSYVECAPYT